MLPRRRRVLAAKVEATAGTAESLTGSEAAFNVFNALIQPNTTNEPREGQGGFSPLASVPGARSGTCTFSTEITAAATVPSWASVFLPACAFIDTSNVFSPKSQPPGGSGLPKTLTMATYIHGVRKMLRGCMGNAVFRFVAGQKIIVDFTFTGIWVDPDDTAILTPTYPTVTPLRFANSGLTIGGYSPKIREMTLDFGNQVILREDANDPSGYCHAAVTGRNINGKLDPELTTVAAKDWHNEWLTMVEQALAISITSGTQLFEVDAPKLQFNNLQEENRNDITTEGVTFQCNRNAAAGDDELTLTIDEAP
jgi:hypothetical protein